ncbi:serine hydroxymethyltransferase [Candidatus Saccharibacteria bacterium]|nr:serine hydroxymethyltransferase [Candidatus Saccharibacteria bacterium]
MKDEVLTKLLALEILRQRQGIELIPSENYVSKDVLEALGSVFTNKYSEGYPGQRYYAGQENTDQVEQLAIDRAKKLFKADHANVQPHSGAQANEVAYNSWCDPGDTILAMDLSHGGHLTHGHPVTMLARQFNFVRYGMKDISTGELDYAAIRKLAKKHQPKIILVGFSAYPREPDYAKFAEIGNEIGAVLMADIAHIAGLIAAGVVKNPFDYGFHMMTSTTHKTLRGPRGGLILTRGKVTNPLKKPEKTIENLPTLVDRTLFPGVQGGPHMHAVLAKAVAFGEALAPEFKLYSKQILLNASHLASELKKRNFKLITGGTSNHMMLIDMLGSRGIDGAEAETALEAIGITSNKNAIPDDTNPPFRPSGLRLGTPAVTTRGLTEEHMELIADWIDRAISSRSSKKQLAELRQQTKEFISRY